MNPFVIDNLKHTLQGKKILLGISGSIAAFKACDIIRYLKTCGAEVRVVLTHGAQNFVTQTTLETLSGNRVLTGFWNEQDQGTHHIDTARWADLILVAPATAHVIAKIAHGMADDLLSTEILASKSPLVIAPAMNPAMYSNPAVQANLEILRSRSIQIVGPATGMTACGEEGLGRMLEPELIVENVASAFYPRDNQKNILITLGPTRSSIDPVRYITNRSSGIMGSALCWAAREKGYKVTAICGPMDVPLPKDIEIIRIRTAKEMADSAMQVWPRSHIFISAAAVLDWDVRDPSSRKLKKEEGEPQLRLQKNPDILKLISEASTRHQFTLGFAAETDSPIENAFQKIKRKGCNAIFANDVSLPNQGFEADRNGGWWISHPDTVIPIETCSKPKLARDLISLIEKANTFHA